MGLIEQLKPISLDTFLPVMQTKKHKDCSHKYSFVSTKQIVEVFADQGWEPIACEVAKSVRADKQGFQKHMISFNNPKLNKALCVGGTIPRIVVKNAHDLSGTLEFLASLLEICCLNGLVAGKTLQEDSYRHVGLSQDAILKAIKSVATSAELALEMSEKMKARILSPEERLDMAHKAIELAYDKTAFAVKPYDLIQNHRSSQNTADLWNTFNTVQEKVIRGGVSRVSLHSKKARKTVGIKAIDRNIQLNRGLWDIAESFIAA